MTLAKTSKAAKQAIASAQNVRCYSLSNSFTGQPVDATVLTSIAADRNSKLSRNDNGALCLHVHSNLWYEFDAKEAA